MQPPPPAAAAPAVRWLQVSQEDAGQRLDNFLIRHLKGVPKTHVYRIIRSGEVRITKGRCAADTRVQAGDSVRLPPVRVAEKAPDAVAAPAREFPILFEDEAFIAEVPELAGCAADGPTRQEALANVETVIGEWIETAQELGSTVPEPKGRLLFA